MVRAAIESLYSGTFDVLGYREIIDPVTFETKEEEYDIFEGLSGRLSYKTTNPSSENGVFSDVTQEVVLFTAPEHQINPGSKIVITQNGRTTEYKSSGQPAVYSSHQEIHLELFKGWA